MPIAAIAVLAVMVSSFFWPGPKYDHQPPATGGIFAPKVKEPIMVKAYTFTATAVYAEPLSPEVAISKKADWQDK